MYRQYILLTGYNSKLRFVSSVSEITLSVKLSHIAFPSQLEIWNLSYLLECNVSDFFTKANSKHKHETRFSSSGNYYVQTSRLNLNQDSFSRFGAKLWNAIPNEFRQLSKGAFKKNFHDFLLSIMEAEDDYVEVPILLQKMANSASSTQCTNNR